MYMATMASTSHGLSVWANSCVKSPINPKTGLSSTLPERNKLRFSIKYDDAYNEVEKTRALYGQESVVDRDWIPERPPVPATVNEKLQAATEQEFYDKLQQLKEENRRTLEAYEQLYKEKLFLEGTRTEQESQFVFQPDKSGVDRVIDPALSKENLTQTSGLECDSSQPVTKKPPPGRPQTGNTEGPTISKTLPQNSVSVLRRERPGSAPVQRRSRSLDQYDWQLSLFESTSLKDSDDFIVADKSDYEAALSKVDKLWEDFKISEYTQRRHSISSDNRKGKKEKTKEWRHRITIPEPFNMSVREALKEKKKTRAQEELELRRLEKQKEEEAECEKKFKAQPVPSHIYLPLYSEITERNESRRKYVKEYCKEMLRSQVKPFNFDLREQEKKHQRINSAPVKTSSGHTKNGFKAKPVPKYIFSSDVDEKLQEEEELRKIRVRMRAKELLRESSLPPNMEAREKLKEQQRKEQAKKAKKMAAKKIRPRSAHAVPDYEMLYREFQKELARRKTMKESTVVEPFELETQRVRRSSLERIRREMEEDERKLKENRWPYSGSRTTPRSSMNYLGALSTSLDAIPTGSTRAADLRTTMTKQEKERLKMRMMEQEEAEKRRRAREAELRRYLNERTGVLDIPKPRDSIAARLREKKLESQKNEKQYQLSKREMKERIQQSPLLIEKYMMESSKNDAVKKVNTIVQSAGLRDEELLRIGDQTFTKESADET